MTESKVVSLVKYRKSKHKPAVRARSATNGSSERNCNDCDAAAGARTEILREYLFEMRELAIRMEAIVRMEESAHRLRK